MIPSTNEITNRRASFRRHRSDRGDRAGLRICAWLVLLASVASAQAQPGQPADLDGLHLRSADGDWRHSVALETDVAFRIRGLVAEVLVRQRYLNDSGEWLEGRHLLPLPDEAAVGRLRVQVGTRVIEGEVREKEAAQAAYQAAASAGQLASVVEQSRPNLYRTAVANIGPGERVDIEIGYWQPVRFSDGAFSIALPLTLVPPFQSTEGAPHLLALDGSVAAPAPVRAAIDLGAAFEPTVSLRIDLDAGVPLASVTSPSHAIHVEPVARGYHVELQDLVELGDRTFELRWTPRASELPQQALFSERLDGEDYLLLMLVPPTVPVSPLPRELILVVDNSGSMHGESMIQAIAAVDRALSRLRPDDRFNVIRFDHTSEIVFPQSVPADAGNVEHARRFVAALRARGGTELMPALELALTPAPLPAHLRQVVLITDAGLSNEQALLDAIERLCGDARIFAVGIGSAPNEHFLRRASELGRGSHVVIRNTGEVDARTDVLLARLDQPALRDLRLHWPGAAEVYPERLPDLYVGEPLQIVARLPALAGELRVEGRDRSRLWQERVSLISARDEHGRGVARLWARAKLTALDDALRRGGDPQMLRDEGLALALRHGLVSRYTSLVAIERSVSRPADADLASAVFANAAPAGSLHFAQGSTSARRHLVFAVLLAFVAALLLGRRRTSESASTQGA